MPTLTDNFNLTNAALVTSKMKLDPTAMGNAFGGATILFMCGILAFAARDLVPALPKSFGHTLDLSPIVPAQAPASNFARFRLGWGALSLYMWMFGWPLGATYDAPAKSRVEQ